jgi:hypothetical protein
MGRKQDFKIGCTVFHFFLIILMMVTFTVIYFNKIDSFCEAVRCNNLTNVRTALKREPWLINAKGLYIKSHPTDFSEIIKTNLNWRKPPLFYSATKEMVELLLIYGADVNYRSSYGDTFLHYMAEEDEEEIMKLLVNSKADVNARNKAGITPFSLLFVDNSVREHDKQVELIEFFLNHGADITTRTPSGDTPLRWALDRNRKDIANSLCRHGAKE